jgi:hypothetical protein
VSFTCKQPTHTHLAARLVSNPDAEFVVDSTLVLRCFVILASGPGLVWSYSYGSSVGLLRGVPQDERLTALVASLFMLTGGLGFVVAPSASAEGGDAWFQSNATPTWETWVPIAYGEGKFVSLSSGSNATTFSPDGKNWYMGGGTATTVDLRVPAALAYGGGRFVSIAVNSTAAMWSDDAGTSWNPGGAAPAPQTGAQSPTEMAVSWQ